MRFSFFGSYENLSSEREALVREAQEALIKDLLKLGWDVVADDTNLRMRQVMYWQALADRCRVNMKVHPLYTDIEECIRRDAARSSQRERMVGEEAIRSMARSSGWPNDGRRA